MSTPVNMAGIGRDKAVELSDGWSWVALSEICEAVNGRAFKSSEWRESGVPIIRIQNLKNRDAQFNYFDGELQEKHRVKSGDLLFAWSGTPGTSFGAHIWKGSEAALNQHIFNIQFDTSQIDTKYFQYALNQNVARYVAQAQGGVGLAHITKKKFMASKIPIGPLTEQKDLVAELDKQLSRLDEAVTNLHRVKANLKRYKAAVLKAAVEGRLVETEAELARREGHTYETGEQLRQCILETRNNCRKVSERRQTHSMLDFNYHRRLPEGWGWADIGTVGVVSGGLTKSRKREGLRRKLPYLRVANVYADELRLAEIGEIGVEEHELPKVLLKKGDLLVVEGNGSSDQIGRLAVWDGSIDPCVHQNHLIKVRMPTGCNPKWVLWWLMSPAGRNLIKSRASSTSGLYTLSLSKISSIPIPLPPAQEQRRICAEVEQTFSLIDGIALNALKSVERSNSLYQAILADTFLRSQTSKQEN